MAIVESKAIHATYHRHKQFKTEDMVLLKIRHLHDDGTESTELKRIINPKRPIYITKPGHEYKTKPEHAPIEHVNKVMTTDAKMFNVAKKALSFEPESRKAPHMGKLKNSPNLFWSSVTVGSIILHHFRTKKDTDSVRILPKVCAIDFEWDVDDQTATIGSYAYEDRSVVIVSREYLRKVKFTDEDKFREEYYKAFDELLAPVIAEYYSRQSVIDSKQTVRVFKPEIYFSDNEFTTMRDTFQLGNGDKADYLTAWNGSSDFTIAEEVCSRYAEPLTAMCADPSIPNEWRNSFFNKGKTGSNKDANGGNKAINPNTEWHELISTSQFQYVDMQSTFHRNRIHTPNLPGSLEWCLNTELGFGKLKYDCGVHEDDKEEWHRTMSAKHPVAYCVYASGDTNGLIVLEEKNFEISSSYFSGVGYSPYGEYVKNPMRLSTDMHFHSLEEGLVVSSVASNMSSDMDKLIVPSRNITVTLNPSYSKGMKLRWIEDSQDWCWIVPDGADGDLTSAYPTGQIMCNGSRDTTWTECCGIVDHSNLTTNAYGYTLAAGPQSNTTIARTMFGLPSAYEISVRLNLN